MRLHVGRRSWLIHHSMAALEEGLDPELFVRLHRSAIVRKDFITGFTRNPSGRWIARLADGDGAAGRPALFGSRPGDRRPLNKRKPPRTRSVRGGFKRSMDRCGHDQRCADHGNRSTAGLCDRLIECGLRGSNRSINAKPVGLDRGQLGRASGVGAANARRCNLEFGPGGRPRRLNWIDRGPRRTPWRSGNPPSPAALAVLASDAVERSSADATTAPAAVMAFNISSLLFRGAGSVGDLEGGCPRAAQPKCALDVLKSRAGRRPPVIWSA